jgi:hypothetical protein
MTKYYQDRLLDAYQLHISDGMDYKQASEYCQYGASVDNHIRATFDRFAKINADMWDVCHYLEGNYLTRVPRTASIEPKTR